MTDPQTPASLPPPMPAAAVTPEPDNMISALLKAPQSVSTALAGGKDLVRTGTLFLFCALAFHAVFGFAVGLFGGLPVATMDLVKVPLIALCALLLCFPSLYVFACVGGAPLTFSQTYALGCACAAMVGLLLVGLAPVAWLFAVSTHNTLFVVLLTSILWVVALGFAGRFVGKLGAEPLFQRSGGIKVWFMILILVTLQMTTCLRPLLAKPEQGWWTGEKKFFLAHLATIFMDDDKPHAPTHTDTPKN